MSYSGDLRESLRSGFRLLARGLKDLDASLRADGLTKHTESIEAALTTLESCNSRFELAMFAAATETAQKFADTLQTHGEETT